jgi:hypothetical protein
MVDNLIFLQNSFRSQLQASERQLKEKKIDKKLKQL